MTSRLFSVVLALSATATFATEVDSQVNPGIHVARAGDSFGGGVNGIGASLELTFPVLPVDLFVAGDYFFPGCDNCSLWGASADVHLPLPVPVLTPYATAGLVMRATDVSDTSERTGGIGIGAGAKLGGVAIGGYGEARYEFMEGEGDQFVFRLGVRF